MAKKKKRAAESWRYVLKADRGLPPEQQTVFILRPLTQAEQLDVKDNAARYYTPPQGGEVQVRRQHRLSLELCLTNILDVENFPAGGPPEKWPADPEARAAFLEGLDNDDVFEVGNEIYAQSLLGPAPKASSPPAPTLGSDGVSGESTSTTASSATGTPG